MEIVDINAIVGTDGLFSILGQAATTGGNMPGFIRNLWYVAAWNRELAAGAIIARTITGESLALFRRPDGTPVAFEDRCPHRMAPLSAGRLEGDSLRCMYHGLRFDCSGACIAVPGTERVPPRLAVRSFPVAERGSWIWAWMGDPARADPALIPQAWGLDDPDWHQKEGALDYDADHQLIHDNLLDLSHLDFLHEQTLGAATGGRWSDEEPAVRAVPGGVHVSRWLRNARPPYSPGPVDTHTSYHFLLPGVFLQRVRIYPLGTADRHPDGAGLPDPVFERVDQQAVTPVAPGRSRYFYAAGLAAKHGDATLAARMVDGLQETFQQDRTMIEAQARVLAATDPRRHMTYIPMDKAPTTFRKLLAERLDIEGEATPAS